MSKKTSFNLQYGDGRWFRGLGYVEGHWAFHNMHYADRWEATYLVMGTSLPGWSPSLKAIRRVTAVLDTVLTPDSVINVRETLEDYLEAHPGEFVFGLPYERDNEHVMLALEEVAVPA